MIIGVGGNLSGGKTVTGVRFCYNKGLQGKKVLSNIKLNFPKEIKYEFISNTELVEFIKTYYEDSDKIREKFENSVMLLDEIVNLLSARKSGSALNELLTNWFMMLGKLSTDVVLTYQLGSSQLDNRVREAIITKEAYCFRMNNKKKMILDNTDRIINEKIYILIIWIENLGIFKKTTAEIYDPQDYFKMYDTKEITLMDRSVFIKGGAKDLTKVYNKPKDKTLDIFSFT